MKKNLVDHKCTNKELWRDAFKIVWLEKTKQCDFLQKFGLHALEDAGGH
jgi:hypothetical protein